MAKSLLWMTNNAKTDDTEVRIFDTSDQAKADITNVVWSYVGDFADYMNATGAKFIDSEWNFQYWNKATRSLSGVLFQGWSGSKTPDELEALLNDASLPAVPFNTADMGTWTVVQETFYRGESSDDDSVIEEDVKYQFRITCDLDATWYFENVLPSGSEDKDDDFARGAAKLEITTGLGFNGTIDPYYNPDNFYIAELKTPDGADANLIKIDSYRDFNYSTLRQSVAPVNLRVREFAVYSNNPNQLLQPFIFDRKTAAGKQYQKVIAPIISPYQQQRYVKTPDLKGYIVDGFTKLNYNVLANTSVRIVMNYSEDMLPMKGVKNPGSSKRIGFSGITPYLPESHYLSFTKDQEGIDEENGKGKEDKEENGVRNPLNETWVRDMEGRECGALKRIEEKIRNKYEKLVSGPTNKLWRKYLKVRMDFLQELMDMKRCDAQYTTQITTVSRS